ncbi:transmembrane alpha-helix domain-containing protein [Lasiosphaeria hispida]|uniref:Transmembrane alpha-helix domain-containing protein n=1 Tax=Lasiosphaeria hispida TaxID=260671 RepID=A0AAJ0H960_9PEZI|nr:transmembrane alpha-helix domain-containing protein [Lasiosphaeria hispida]
MSNSTTPLPDTSTTVPPTILTSSTTPPPPPTSTPLPDTSTSAPTTPTPPTSTSPTPTTPTSAPPLQTQTTVITSGGETRTTVLTVTAPGSTPSFGTSISPPSSTTSSGSAISPSEGSTAGLTNSGKIAIAVVVPIAAVALLILAGIFFWRKRKQRKDAEEQRRKEVEDYGYNPNADPTIPAVAGAGPYEMKEDGSSGYRGWGTTTLAGSSARKASTTMSGGGGVAYSDATSPTRGGLSDTRSGEPLMAEAPSPSPDAEALGAMGPSAASNRSDVRRGPSNASSSYSNAARSDGSEEAPIGVAYGGNSQHYDQYSNSNPYIDGLLPTQPGGTAELGGQPVIRDVTARRNTRIENPAHYPQQSAGIAQNF